MAQVAWQTGMSKEDSCYRTKACPLKKQQKTGRLSCNEGILHIFADIGKYVSI